MSSPTNVTCSSLFLWGVHNWASKELVLVVRAGVRWDAFSLLCVGPAFRGPSAPGHLGSLAFPELGPRPFGWTLVTSCSAPVVWFLGVQLYSSLPGRLWGKTWSFIAKLEPGPLSQASRSGFAAGRHLCSRCIFTAQEALRELGVHVAPLKYHKPFSLSSFLRVLFY